MNYQKAIAECQKVNAYLAKLPYRLDVLKTSNAKETARAIVLLNNVRKTILSAQSDFQLSDIQINELSRYLNMFNAKLRILI